MTIQRTGADKWITGDDKYLSTSLVSRGFLRQLMRAKIFKLEFTPAGQQPQIASFELGNIKELIQREKDCNFMKKAFPFPE
ncbi:MAG TPA: hypothetical protein VGN44_21815 [Candidatus Angelobacter sp.]